MKGIPSPHLSLSGERRKSKAIQKRLIGPTPLSSFPLLFSKEGSRRGTGRKCIQNHRSWCIGSLRENGTCAYNCSRRKVSKVVNNAIVESHPVILFRRRRRGVLNRRRETRKGKGGIEPFSSRSLPFALEGYLSFLQGQRRRRRALLSLWNREEMPFAFLLSEMETFPP